MVVFRKQGYLLAHQGPIASPSDFWLCRVAPRPGHCIRLSQMRVSLKEDAKGRRADS